MALVAAEPTATFTGPELEVARKLSEDLARMLLAKAGEEVAKLVPPEDILARVLAPDVGDVSKVHVALVDGNIELLEKRQALLGDTASLTFQRFEPGTLVVSDRYVPGTRLMKDARIVLADAHRVSLTVNVEEILLVDGRAYLMKLD